MFGHSWVKRKGCTCFNLDMDVGTHSRTDFPPILHSFCNHINLVFPAKAKLLLTGQALALNPFISFLPLKHSFEHSLGTWVNVNGVISGRYWRLLWTFMGFPCSSVSKESACSAGDLGSIFGSGRSPGEGNGNPLHAFAWKIPRTEEPGGLHSMGSQRVGHEGQWEHILRNDGNEFDLGRLRKWGSVTPKRGRWATAAPGKFAGRAAVPGDWDGFYCNWGLTGGWWSC